MIIKRFINDAELQLTVESLDWETTEKENC